MPLSSRKNKKPSKRELEEKLVKCESYQQEQEDKIAKLERVAVGMAALVMARVGEEKVAVGTAEAAARAKVGSARIAAFKRAESKADEAATPETALAATHAKHAIQHVLRDWRGEVVNDKSPSPDGSKREEEDSSGSGSGSGGGGGGGSGGGGRGAVCRGAGQIAPCRRDRPVP